MVEVETYTVMQAFLIALAASAFICKMLVRSADWHLLYTADTPGDQPQKFHTTPTPRIGGLGIIAGILIASLLAGPSGEAAPVYWFLLLSLLPAFFGGFLEDITRRVPPWTRLLATAITAGFAFALADVRFVRSDVGWLDAAFTFAPFAYASLLLAVAGIAHAMNLIDGYNGLSAGVGAIILMAMGVVGAQAGDTLVAGFCFTTAGALCGFLLLNYPGGRLFLGDGGAYLQGCVIAIAAVMLVQRNPSVSPWFPFALVAYPIWETLFSILRRAFLHRTAIGQPDARHMHSMVYRRLAWRWVTRRGEGSDVLRNAITTLPFWFVSALMAVLAVLWHDSTAALQWQAVIFIAGYCLVYQRIARLRRPMSFAIWSYLRSRAERRKTERVETKSSAQ